jgi:SAM-dependent methyltransferase
MKTVQEHYAEHLAPIYLWTMGGAEIAFALAESELDALSLPARKGDPVLDLGAGFGMHTIPLARRGADVTAVDTSAELLDSLQAMAGELSLRTVNNDLIGYLRSTREQYAAILCMGDTVTHLKSVSDVHELFDEAHRTLSPGGTFVLTFRDYTAELLDEQRFIPVKADDTRIHTCFLEYAGSTMAVHDIVHGRTQAGWQTKVSAYVKLRLAPDDLLASLSCTGFVACKETGLRGMVRLVATRP